MGHVRGSEHQGDRHGASAGATKIVGGLGPNRTYVDTQDLIKYIRPLVFQNIKDPVTGARERRV